MVKYIVFYSSTNPVCVNTSGLLHLSPGYFDLAGPRCIQVPPDGVIVYACPHCHKDVPDGMGEWDEAITLEEDNSQAVEDSAH